MFNSITKSQDELTILLYHTKYALSRVRHLKKYKEQLTPCFSKDSAVLFSCFCVVYGRFPYFLSVSNLTIPFVQSIPKSLFSSYISELEVDKIIELLKNFKSDPIQNQQWQNYAKKYSYTQGILLSDVLDEMNSLLMTLKSTNSD